jgi:hypothetical protein
VGQETPVSGLPPSGTNADDHAEAFGPTLTNASPRPSTATHGPPGAHETAFNDSPRSIGATLQLGLGFIGSDVLSAYPWWSTPTQSDSEAHETALRALPGSNDAGADQPSKAVA